MQQSRYVPHKLSSFESFSGYAGNAHLAGYAGNARLQSFHAHQSRCGLIVSSTLPDSTSVVVIIIIIITTTTTTTTTKKIIIIIFDSFYNRRGPSRKKNEY